MKKWPLKFKLHADATAGVDYTQVPGATAHPPHGWTVPVFAYEITRTARQWNDDHGQFLLQETMLIYAPPKSFASGQRVGESERLDWTIDGNAEDNNNNPWWQPGLVTYIAKRTEFGA